MVMASIARLYKPGAFVGAVAWVAVSEALGVPVNVVHPMDITARKRMDLGLVKDGAGQEVDGEGYQWSCSHRPQKTHLWLLPDAGGMAREEVNIIVVKSSPALENPTEEQLQTVGEVQNDTPNIDDTTDHFAAVVVKDGTTLLCPIHLIAPRQRAADDASGKEGYDKRVLACKEQQAVRERQAAGVQAGSDSDSDTVATDTTASEVVAAKVVWRCLRWWCAGQDAKREQQFRQSKKQQGAVRSHPRPDDGGSGEAATRPLRPLLAAAPSAPTSHFLSGVQLCTICTSVVEGNRCPNIRWCGGIG
ncbi:unnamed protein product [Ectocarpus sp. CCAP 1310/34]|nr:unnamed protein product [Ectocarpus sp. CCAP 1310/34]